MTRKDYIKVANIIKWNKMYQPNPELVSNPVETVLERVANALANEMFKDNQNFDHKRFMEACGF